MRREVNTLSKGRGLPQQLREQLCPHPDKGASPQPQRGACIVCHLLSISFALWLRGGGGCRIFHLLALIQPAVWRPQPGEHL